MSKLEINTTSLQTILETVNNLPVVEENKNNDYKLIFNIVEGNNSYTYLSINENGEETIYDLHFALGRWGDVAVDSSNNAFSKRDYYFQ